METISTALFCSVFPGGYALYFFLSFAASSLFSVLSGQQTVGVNFLNMSYWPVGDLKRASTACASAARNLTQTEMINLIEQPHHLSHGLGHCKCPRATCGRSVCASPRQETFLWSYRQPWGFCPMNAYFLCNDSWLIQTSVPHAN